MVPNNLSFQILFARVSINLNASEDQWLESSLKCKHVTKSIIRETKPEPQF